MFQNKCTHCGNWFESVRPDSFLCTKACQSASQRVRDRERVRRSKELLTRFSAVMDSGADIVVLESLSREAKELLGARS